MDITPLPFEYEARYADHGKTLGFDLDKSALLEERDRQLEDHLAARTLDMLVDVDTTSTPPADGDGLIYDAASSLWVPGAVGAGGGVTQAFVADSVGTTVVTITSGNTGSPSFRVQGGNSVSRFQTDEVTDMASAVTQVSLTAGLWDLQALIYLTPDATLPTSGYCDVLFDYGNEWVRVPWRQITDPGSTNELASVWLHRRYYLTSGSGAIGFWVDNYTDQTIKASCKVFSGVRLAGAGDLALR